MLDSNLVDTIQNEFNVAKAGELKRMASEWAQTQNRFGAQGAGHSTPLMDRLQQVCEQALWGLFRSLMNALVRAIDAFGVDVSDATAGEIVGLVEARLAPVALELEARLKQASHNIGFENRWDLHEVQELIKKKTAAEAEMLAASLRKRVPTARADQAFHIHGNVGAIMTGSGSSARVVQGLSSEDTAQVLRAVQEVRRAIEEAAALQGAEQEELLDTLEELSKHLGSGKPNLTKVRGLGLGVATTIQTIGALQPAYAALRTGLAVLGVFLP
jgi:hypothetical protein